MSTFNPAPEAYLLTHAFMILLCSFFLKLFELPERCFPDKPLLLFEV